MTTDSEWTDWIPHVAGDPCPIPTVKAGEFALRFSHTVRPDYKTVGTPEHYCWQKNAAGISVTHYRLRKPSPDWRGIAEELARALSYQGVHHDVMALASQPKEKRYLLDGMFRNAKDNIEYAEKALTRYREAIETKENHNEVSI